MQDHLRTEQGGEGEERTAHEAAMPTHLPGVLRREHRPAVLSAWPLERDQALAVAAARQERQAPPAHVVQVGPEGPEVQEGC